MKTFLNIIAAIIILSIGFGLGYWRAQPTPMQKMLGIHDHMRSPEIRYWWRQTYCGDDKSNPPMDGVK